MSIVKRLIVIFAVALVSTSQMNADDNKDAVVKMGKDSTVIRKATIKEAEEVEKAALDMQRIRSRIGVPNYNVIYGRNDWLTGNNVSGMRCDSVNISVAEIGGGYIQGDNRTYSMAPKEWQIGAQAASIKHLKKFSLAGQFSFTQTTSYDGRGSMLAYPGRYPIDIYEFTPGDKSRQRYAFKGGISADMTDEWRIGAELDFAAINYAKRKDLRYTTYNMELSFRPSFQWHDGDLAAGGAVMISRTSDNVKAEQVGSAKESYKVFLDKGMFYGVEQEWQNISVHLNESGINCLPIAEMGYGVSGQVSWRGLYAEVAYTYGDGVVGEKDAIWYTFPSHKGNAIISWRFSSPGGIRNRLRLDAWYQYRYLNENIIEKVTEGGITTRKILGYNTINRTSLLSLSPYWKMDINNYGIMVTGFYTREEGLETLQYPYYTSEVIRKGNITVQASGRWAGVTLYLSVYGGAGWLDAKATDKVIPGAPETEGVPFREPGYYGFLWYSTAPMHGGRLDIRYDFYKGLYVAASVDLSYRKLTENAPAISQWENYRVYSGLSFGYSF